MCTVINSYNLKRVLHCTKNMLIMSRILSFIHISYNFEYWIKLNSKFFPINSQFYFARFLLVQLKLNKFRTNFQKNLHFSLFFGIYLLKRRLTLIISIRKSLFNLIQHQIPSKWNFLKWGQKNRHNQFPRALMRLSKSLFILHSNLNLKFKANCPEPIIRYSKLRENKTIDFGRLLSWNK